MPYGKEGYDDSTINDLEIGREGEEEEEGGNTTTCNSLNTEIEASSIIKLNNGDVLYMKEINRYDNILFMREIKTEKVFN